MLKSSVLKIIKETVDSQKETDFNRIEKYQIFCNVCDNMLHAGQITKTQHKRWTEVF